LDGIVPLFGAKEKQMSDQDQLEAEFKKVFDDVHGQIQEKVRAAAKLLNEAAELSKQHGMPFRPEETIMFCKPSYIPQSFAEKFAGLVSSDSEYWTELTNAHGSVKWYGWQQSQVC
jgi:hypothetical protein